MDKRTYKREDMIELNEENVAGIFNECLAENHPEENNPFTLSFLDRKLQVQVGHPHSRN